MYTYTPIDPTKSGYIAPGIVNQEYVNTPQPTQADYMALQAKLNALLNQQPVAAPAATQPAAVDFNQYNPVRYNGGGSNYNNQYTQTPEFAVPQTTPNSDEMYPALKKVGGYVKDFIGNLGANVLGGVSGAALGNAIGGPFGTIVGAQAGADVSNWIRATIKKPGNDPTKDPYTSFRPENKSGNEGMSVADQYASYGAGSRGQTNPNSNANYSTPSGNEGMSVSQQYSSYGSGRQGDGYNGGDGGDNGSSDGSDSNDNSSYSGSDTSGGSN